MGGEEKRPSPRRWILLAVVLLAVVAFVLPPLVNISRYQHRIAESISRSIGRQVHISSVKLRLLPLPGFEFSDFSVEEDPQFVLDAPHNTRIQRLDETAAARKPILRWTPGN